MPRFIFTSIMLLTLLALPPVTFAEAKYSIKEMTPQVEKALDSRRSRYSQLEKLKAGGVLGENNRGYVEVLKNNSQAAQLASAENADRKVIYQTIAQQNNLGGALETIEKVFAQVQREKADPGQMIQQENGEWRKK